MQNMFGFVLGRNKPTGNWLKCMCEKCLAAECIAFEKYAEAKRICACLLLFVGRDKPQEK